MTTHIMMACFRHSGLTAVDNLNVPCAALPNYPKGKLPCCSHCLDPRNRAEVFAAYKEMYPKQVEDFNKEVDEKIESRLKSLL